MTTLSPTRPGPKISALQDFLFRCRVPILLVLGIFTAVMAWFAVQLHMDAGFEKQMPIGHPYIKTFHEYRGDLLSPNRLNIVVKAKHGTIWTANGLKRLYDVTQAVMYLPNIERLGVQSLWTPNSFVNEITEEGFRAEPVIPGTVTAAALNDAAVDAARHSAMRGRFIGTLVGRDQTSAMVSAELLELDAQGRKLDYVAYNHLIEEQVRQKFEDADFDIQIIGFAKQIGDIADGAVGVLRYCALSVLLAALSVWWYCRSWRFTILPILCSLASLVWQFGCLRLLGYGLDPLAILVPFLVFAIGVSHGVQQINFIVREISKGADVVNACKASFSGLLVPGTLALVTALVSFLTLLFIPIPMIREVALTASLGVGFKIVTNLAMLPLAASFVHVSKEYAQACTGRREQRARWLSVIAHVGNPRVAAVILVISAAVFATSVWQSRDRVVGTLLPGAPELRVDSRFNLDAVAIASQYDTGLDWLSVVFEAPPQSCDDVRVGAYQERYAWSMRSVPGLLAIASFADQMRSYNLGYNEGNPKMNVLPIDPATYAALATEMSRSRGLMRNDCSMTAVHLFLTDHKATTINAAIQATKKFKAADTEPGLNIRLAAGNAGVLAAIDEVVERSELPMMLYVYAAILLLVGLVYRDWRAMLACCLPLTIATFIGYWFMKEEQIGLTVATLPVMVLAVGIGVDYALYIYNRLQLHLSMGASMEQALLKALEFEAMATVFTALTLAVCVVTWAWSDLKFQADMGKLLAFMFIINLVMSLTTLPALAVWLEKLFPRRSARRRPKVSH